VDATCGKHGYTGDTYCKSCGKLLKKGSATPVTDDHSYGEWVINAEPTATTDGQQERECTVCGYRESEIIPALGNPDTEPTVTQPAEATDPTDATTPTEHQPEPTVKPTEPATQDSDAQGNFTWIIVALVVVAVVCVVIVIPKGKKTDR
jgi:hypothetical protein